MTTFDRRTVLMTSGLAIAHRGLDAFVSAGGQETASAYGGEEGALWATFPSADPEMVGTLVGAAHADVDTVAEIVGAHPALARASIDWGFGDWESALGAAAHMGRRDIAGVLIDHGARPNVFSAAMLGQLDVVRAFVGAQPGIQRTPGPHGISLLAHARAGGEPAAAVYEYLEALGDADPSGPETFDMSAEQRAGFVGTYAFGDGALDRFHVEENRERLSLRREGRPFGRMIFPVSESEFYPSGSWVVRVAFDLEDGAASVLRVIDGEVVMSARRTS